MQKKYVSFLSVIFMVLGTTIGSGIFFKNETILNNTGSIIFSLLAWAIAIFAIICICMTLGEIVKRSGLENSDGYIGWIKKFCSTGMYKGFRNFMFWLFIPICMFVLPYYAIMSLQDSLSVFFEGKCVMPWYAVILCSFTILIYFQYMGIAHKDVSVKQSIALTYIKFIPILFAIFGGIFYFALKGSAQNPVLNSSAANSNAPFNLIKFSPIFGVMSAIPAIFFAFDGFYSVGGVYADMKEPKKFSSALSIGIAITSAIYLLISIGLLLGAKGGAINGWLDVLTTPAGKVLMFIISFCIFLAVITVVDVYAIFSGKFYFNMLKIDDNKIHTWIKSKININDTNKFAFLIVGYLLAFNIVYTIIGTFYFRGTHISTYYDDTTGNIYGFCDLIGDFKALISFVGIGLVVLTAIIKKINTSKKYLFCAISGVFVIALCALFQIVDVSSDLVSSIIFQIHNKDISVEKYLIPSICRFNIALIFFCVCFVPAIKEKITKKLHIH